MKISTKFGGPTSAGFQVISKRTGKTPQKRKKKKVKFHAKLTSLILSMLSVSLKGLKTLYGILLDHLHNFEY